MNPLSPNGSLVSLETWLGAITSSACIGFTSLVPWLFNLTFFEKRTITTQQEGGEDGGESRMKYLLSFAIGAILGDIFFHLIPESIESHLTELGNSIEVAERNVGISIIAGIFLFIIVEMVLQKWSGQQVRETQATTILSDPQPANDARSKKIFDKVGQDLKNPPKHNGKCAATQNDSVLTNDHNKDPARETTDSNGNSLQQEDIESAKNISDQMNNNYLDGDQNLIQRKHKNSPRTICESDLRSHSNGTSPNTGLRDTHDKSSDATKNLAIDPAGYLNLIANGFDNFTHGLAIGASFLVGTKVGVLTTFVIFIHEIPHEICDYAILVKSGFSRWEAVKAQSSVSLFGIMGTALALYVKSIDKLHAKTVWILPFSAGGFLYIALVTLLPDILDKQSNMQDSLGQIASVILGVAFMGLVALL